MEEPDPRDAPLPQPSDRSSPEAIDHGRTPLFWAVLAALWAGALSLRVLGATGDLWLDEIWSVNLAFHVDSAGGIFTEIHSDNNHWLNTLLLHWIGLTDRFWIYRLFSMATGVGTVILVTLAALRRGRLAALIAATLFGFSFALIHLSSEARGYAPAMFFAVAAYFLMRRYLRRGGRSIAFAFSVTAALGFLSHLTFLWVYIGLALWWCSDLRRRDPSLFGALGSFITLHALPSLTGLGLLLLDIRHWTIEGVVLDGVSLPAALAELMRWTFGIPDLPWLLPAASLAIGVLAAREIVRMGRANNSEHLFFLAAFVIGPIAIALAGTGWYPYRYFATSIPFLLLLLAQLAERAALKPGVSRTLCASVLLLFLIGNGWLTNRFLEHHRGQYGAAVEHIAAEAPAPRTTISFVGYHAPRGQAAIIEFYQRFLPEEVEIVIIPPLDPELPAPDWLVVQDPDPEHSQPPHRLKVGGGLFKFHEQFRHWGPSGWSWNLYRRQEASSTSRAPAQSTSLHVFGT